MNIVLEAKHTKNTQFLNEIINNKIKIQRVKVEVYAVLNTRKITNKQFTNVILTDALKLSK